MNRIEKQKTGLLVIAILSLIFGLCALGGGIAMFIGGIGSLMAKKWVAGVLLVVFGILLAIAGGAGTVWGIYTVWIGSAIKATKGSIAEDNLGKGTVNGKVCPKCGCTNTSDATVCAVCHTPLDAPAEPKEETPAQ